MCDVQKRRTKENNKRPNVRFVYVRRYSHKNKTFPYAIRQIYYSSRLRFTSFLFVPIHRLIIVHLLLCLRDHYRKDGRNQNVIYLRNLYATDLINTQRNAFAIIKSETNKIRTSVQLARAKTTQELSAVILVLKRFSRNFVFCYKYINSIPLSHSYVFQGQTTWQWLF